MNIQKEYVPSSKQLVWEIYAFKLRENQAFLHATGLTKQQVDKMLLESKKWTLKQRKLLNMGVLFWEGSKGDIPKAYPIKVDEVHVTILCPYRCGEKHRHGSCGGKDYAGTRVAHCKNKPSVEYEIVRMIQ